MGIKREELIEILAQSLHIHSYYGESRSWEIPDRAKLRKIVDDVEAYISKYYMREDSKEEWRYMARRFIDQIVPKVTNERVFDLDDNVIDFQKQRELLLQTAGGEPPKGENWLNDLEIGTIFLARPKTKGQPQQLHCDKFCVVDKKEVTTNLIQKAPMGQQIDVWFPTLEFSRSYTLIEVLGVVKLEYSEERVEIDNELPEDSEAVRKEEGDGNDRNNGDGVRPIR